MSYFHSTVIKRNRKMPPPVPSKFARVPSPDEIDLIDVMNDLQNKLVASGHSVDISLPQLVVIGCQSAGKSSVLESFVGKEFLPRGTRLVTRRPIVVQLIPSREEYGVFLHAQPTRIYDFNAIREEIVRATDEECGPTGFSSKPISLTIYSPRVLKLTLVDLPGIIRVTVGDQDAESIQTVRDMVLEYIMKDKCIILAVTPTGQDLANSDALELAKIADPGGERTIGVLTKLDLMEEGTDARDILDNTHLPLKRGWVGVINRSSKEIADGKNMEYILKKERDFFQNSELYSHMAHRMGTPYLQKLLQKTLRVHIKKCLPEVRAEISQKLLKFQKEVKDLDSVIGSGPNARQIHMVSIKNIHNGEIQEVPMQYLVGYHKLIQKFSDEIHISIMGYSETVAVNTLTHGALINFKLNTEVQRILQQVLLPDEEEITLYVASINGMRNSISIPSLVVDAVCRRLIERFKEPLETAVTCVKDTLLDAIREKSYLLDSYPSMRNELVYQIKNWIDHECESTKERLKSHIDAETFYINTGHPDFDSSTCDPVAAVAGPLNVWKEVDIKAEQEDPDEIDTVKNLLKSNKQMQNQVQYVSALVIKYLEIIQKQVSDTAIKYIAYFLVKRVLDSIKYNLVTVILDSANIASITEDCDDDIKRKEELERTCRTLTAALEAIKSF